MDNAKVSDDEDAPDRIKAPETADVKCRENNRNLQEMDGGDNNVISLQVPQVSFQGHHAKSTQNSVSPMTRVDDLDTQNNLQILQLDDQTVSSSESKRKRIVGKIVRRLKSLHDRVLRR